MKECCLVVDYQCFRGTRDGRDERLQKYILLKSTSHLVKHIRPYIYGFKPLFTMKFSEKQEEFYAHIPVTLVSALAIRKIVHTLYKE
jgi:hypothetical protein